MSLSVDITKKLPDFTLETAFAVEDGTLGLLGSSGSGKSMTLKCIAGLIRPDTGRIVLDGRVLFDSAAGIDLPPQRRRTGYLFQNYALFPHMTVAQNIRCGMRSNGRANGIGELVQQLHLEGLENRYPAQLSGGQQQRAALARIVASKPAVLMLDEPFSALDACLREEMQQTVAQLLRTFEGAALVVSHDRNEIYRLCDRVAIYHAGQIDRIGEKRQIFESPGTQTAAVLTGCDNLTPASRQPGQRLKAALWGVSLTTAYEVPENVTAVGIRAHCLRAVRAPGENTIACRLQSVTESPFEVTLYLQPQGGSSPLCWKISREMYQKLPNTDVFFFACRAAGRPAACIRRREKMMLRCAIVYTTLNDNTRRLAECMYGALPRGVCLYMGKPCRQALAADVIFWGNNAGIQSAEIDAFLEQAKQRILVPFGHTCFGGGKDMCAIGAFACNVMRQAEQMLQQDKTKNV